VDTLDWNQWILCAVIPGDFGLEYAPKRAVVVNLSLREMVKVEETEVVFVPFWEIPLSLSRCWVV
jgi:hypothetical protein